MLNKITTVLFDIARVKKQSKLLKKCRYFEESNLSASTLESCIEWYAQISKSRHEVNECIKELIVKSLVNFPVQAYKLYSLYCNKCPNDELFFIDRDALESAVLSQLKVGVAVITYNRIESLKATVASIQKFSALDIELMVADDGSNDGTKEWCDGQNIACISLENSGVATNKNRALYVLHEVDKCDISILIEDDCRPIEYGWDKAWALSALIWGHINFAHDRVLSGSKRVEGNGSIFSPYISKAVTGQCTATSYEAFCRIGYLNPVFKGYGCGHVEWTERFVRAGYNGGSRYKVCYPCINIGLHSEDASTYKNQDDINRNRAIKAGLSGNTHFVFPWQSEKDKLSFIESIKLSKNDSIFAKSRDKIERKLTALELNGNFFFIHVPKTAGTSFRCALEDKYNVIGDYGKDSKHTTNCIKIHSYEQNSFYELKCQFEMTEDTWLVGHVPLHKYSDMVSVRHIVTFLRDPVQQVISHFNHYVTHHAFAGDIEEFLKMPMASNFQRKNLNPLPLGLIGYVGLTDCYEESIELINCYYGIDIEVKKANVNIQKTIDRDTISPTLQQKIEKINQLDLKCVAEARFLHKQRKRLTEENKEWVYSHFTISPNNILSGCAYYSHSDAPVDIDILINGKRLTTITADMFFGSFGKVNFPRGRYIGIHFVLPSDLDKDDIIEVVATSTGQKLTFEPLKPAVK